MSTMTNTSASQMLSVFDTIRINHDEKISNEDRLICENQQQLLYQSLLQIDKWYNIYLQDVEQYKESHRVKFHPNGSITYNAPYNPCNNTLPRDYCDFEFRPFDAVNNMVSSRQKAISYFARTIVSYFNNKYNLSVPRPELDTELMLIDDKPQYTTYVDMVISHLGGRGFREKAEDEVIRRLHNIIPQYGSKIVERIGNKIVFYNIHRFDSFWFQYNKNQISYNDDLKIDVLCENIALFCDGSLGGNSKIIPHFDTKDVNITEPYNLNVSSSIKMKFYKNGRIDIVFPDSEMAMRCFSKMRLHEITPKN